MEEAGKYPYTGGIYPLMYLYQLWTMRQFAGFGSAEDLNERFKFLLSIGETGLSTAFDMPTLLGYDSDHHKARGDIGRGGVAVCTIEDMELLFRDIPLDKVTTSMTINAPASVLLAMYIVVAKKQKVPLDKIGGTIQNDILKEYTAQNEIIFPVEPSMRLIVDTIEFCSEHLPKFHPISISGYHIREAGSTAVQESAFTLADGIAYVEACLNRGLDIDKFAPGLSFFFNSHNDFLEEIAKLRAARRLWAKIIKERFGAKNEKSMMLRTHVQTAGCTLTHQEPLNNIARVAIQALAAVLGGTQSLHTNSYDEEICLPSEEAVTVALRTQQIIAHETGVTKFVDPLAGSYVIEDLTLRLEAEAFNYIKKIDEMGGMVEAIKQGFPQMEIRKSAFETQRAIDAGKEIVVGVNLGHKKSTPYTARFKVDPESQTRQLARLKNFKKERNEDEAERGLWILGLAAKTQENLMPHIISAVERKATLGEICQTLAEVFGRHKQGNTII